MIKQIKLINAVFKLAREGIKSAFNLLLPATCTLCTEEIKPSAQPPVLHNICADCQEVLPFSQHSCAQCAVELEQPDTTFPERSEYCAECLEAPPAFDRIYSAAVYEAPIDLAINALKHRHKPFLAKDLAALWWHNHHVSLKFHDPIDIICSVPMHRNSLMARQYNQAELIAEEIYRLTKRACEPNTSHPNYAPYLLLKSHPTQHQQGLNRRQRMKNLAKCFTCTRDISHKRIALVDDVVTTGATARTLAALLKDAGAKSVDIWCIARTPKRKK